MIPAPRLLPLLLLALATLCGGCARAELARLLPRLELRAALSRARLDRESADAGARRQAWGGRLEVRLGWPLGAPPPTQEPLAPPPGSPPPPRAAPPTCALPLLCRWEGRACARALRAFLDPSSPRPAHQGADHAPRRP